MKISKEGLSLIKKFEGCELEAYKCAAGVWTIGYGSTKGVKEGDTITQEEADELLLHEMEEYEGYINNMVTVDLKQNQFDALVSWVFNLGSSNLSSSTLLNRLNNKVWDDVPAQMKKLDVDVFQLETQDKQHARGMFSKDWTARIIGLVTIGGFLGYIFLVTLQPPEQNSEALINLVLGYLGGLASAIISFYFGASNTSDKKE
jgi:lysozyme